MTNFYRLRIPKLEFAPSFVRPTPNNDKTTHSWNYSADKVMSDEMLKYFKLEFLIDFETCLMFTVAGKNHNNIHLDGYGHRVNTWAINYIFDTTNSKMVWYKSKTNPFVYKPDIGNLLHVWNDGDADPIQECFTKDGDILLAKTNIPHNVVNNCEETRWCFSFRGSRYLTWDTVVDRLSGVSTTESARVS